MYAAEVAEDVMAYMRELEVRSIQAGFCGQDSWGWWWSVCFTLA